MTRRELAEKLSQRFKTLPQREAEVIVKEVFNCMTEALARGDRIEIRGFGTFFLKERRAREGRNPKSGNKVHVDAKRVPFFKVGKELKKRVDK